MFWWCHYLPNCDLRLSHVQWLLLLVWPLLIVLQHARKPQSYASSKLQLTDPIGRFLYIHPMSKWQMFHTQILKNPDILQQWNLMTGCAQWMLIEDMWDNKGNIIQASINSRHPIMLIFVITNRILIRNVNTKPIYKILQIHNGNIIQSSISRQPAANHLNLFDWVRIEKCTITAAAAGVALNIIIKT